MTLMNIFCRLQKLKTFNKDDETHVIGSLVIDFVLGVKSPPAPSPETYMDQSLASKMASFQEQMAAEVRAAGGDEQNQKLIEPEMVKFWEMDWVCAGSLEPHCVCVGLLGAS